MKRQYIALAIVIALWLGYAYGNVDGSSDVDDPDGGGFDLETIYSSTIGAVMAFGSGQTVSANGIAFIQGFEGCQLTAYYDVTGYSIGYGHKPASQGQTITQAQANAYCASDCAAAAVAVLKAVRVPLTQNQLDALTSWVYNLGSGKVAGSTLYKQLNAGNYDAVPDELVRWCNVNGSPDASLLARRQAEAALWGNSTAAANTQLADASTTSQDASSNALLADNSDSDGSSPDDNGDDGSVDA